MKIRVTLITENNKHPDITDEEACDAAVMAWNFIIKFLERFNKDPSEKATVESAEVVEK